MKNPTTLRIAAAAFLSCTLGAAFAAPMAPADYKGAKQAVEDTYKADKAACKNMKGNAGDICKAEAKAKERVALAELEYGQSATTPNAVKVANARADGTFAVAKEKCDDLSGQPKSLCRTEAGAAHTKALADAKLTKEVAAAKTDAREDKKAADRKVAMEKCDALAGEPKNACVAAVKARFDSKS